MPMESKTKERLLTVRKLCQERDLNPSTVWWWVRERKFPIIRVGKKVLIPEHSFERFIRTHTEVPPDEEY